MNTTCLTTVDAAFVECSGVRRMSSIICSEHEEDAKWANAWSLESRARNDG